MIGASCDNSNRRYGDSSCPSGRAGIAIAVEWSFTLHSVQSADSPDGIEGSFSRPEKKKKKTRKRLLEAVARLKTNPAIFPPCW